MTTAFGPQGPNYATVRPPADPQASAGSDTWFQNCTAAGAKDGTFATADFFNVTLGNLRYLVRTAGVILDDTDDEMVYKAINKLIEDAFEDLFYLYLKADRGIKIHPTTKFIESTLGDGTRTVLV